MGDNLALLEQGSIHAVGKTIQGASEMPWKFSGGCVKDTGFSREILEQKGKCLSPCGVSLSPYFTLD